MLDEAWANFAIDSCLANGIDHFFVAPGSRCTPLTLAIARRPEVRVTQHFDERGLAFAALGYGRATSRPSVFVCTSGTAVANAYPAVIEAAIEKIPLLLFTADRPEELHGTGANQTIDQANIFGDYPELFVNIPVAEDTASESDPQGIEYLTGELARVFDAAFTGPVHTNWMFREPFTIDDSTTKDAEQAVKANIVELRSSRVTDETSDKLPIKVLGNVLIALGRCTPAEATEALKLSRRLNCPLLSDITSGLKTGSFELPSSFDLPRPETVLHLGGRIVSKSWLQWTNSIRDSGTQFIHITPDGQPFNPNDLAQSRLQTSLDDLETNIVGEPTSDAFRDAWLSANQRRTEVIERELADAPELTEPAIAFFLSKNCPVDSAMFIGNSMPIRDMDWFGVAPKNSSTPRFITANRGASGIDGLLATATGYATGLNRPTTVVLGDLSALHDLNSLSLVACSDVPMIVVIINNSGGHIFDLLPINRSQHFEQFFATPHFYQFEHAAKMFSLDYHRIESMSDFADRYRESTSQDRSVVLELVTDRQQNVAVRKRIQEAISQCRPS